MNLLLVLVLALRSLSPGTFPNSISIRRAFLNSRKDFVPEKHAQNSLPKIPFLIILKGKFQFPRLINTLNLFVRKITGSR